jgi:hypothetical protein
MYLVLLLSILYLLILMCVQHVLLAGLLLCLFGGCQKNSSDKKKVAIRGDPHCLVVGINQL